MALAVAERRATLGEVICRLTPWRHHEHRANDAEARLERQTDQQRVSHGRTDDAIRVAYRTIASRLDGI